MKKSLYLLVVSIFIFGCNSNEPEFGSQVTSSIEAVTDNVSVETVDSNAGQIFNGIHKLAKNKNDKYLYLYNSTDYRSLVCSFIWETNDGYYSSNYIMYNNVRFEIDETVTEPYVKFHWDSDNSNRNIQNYIYHSVNYIVIITNNENFQEIISYANQPNGQIVSSDN